MPAVSRLGDQGIHIGSGQSGTISAVTTTDVRTADGKLIARQGDSYTCSVSGHGTNPLIAYPTQVDTSADGVRVITVGAKSTCGATIIQGYAQAITMPPGAPIAIGTYTGTTTVNVPLVISASSLIATGLDLNLLPLTLASVQSPVNGTVSMTPPGFVTFIPTTSYVGPASFTYTLTSSNGNPGPLPANITVNP
jgi:uncharacterized Zn-binding protein involved in type VI secretion